MYHSNEKVTVTVHLSVCGLKPDGVWCNTHWCMVGWCWYRADVDSGLMVYGGWWLMSKLGFFAADFQLCRSKTLLWVSALESSEIFSIPGCNVTIINLCWSPRYFSRSCQMIFFCGRWLWGSVRSRGRRWLVATKLLPPRSTTRWDFLISTKVSNPDNGRSLNP